MFSSSFLKYHLNFPAFSWPVPTFWRYVAVIKLKMIKYFFLRFNHLICFYAQLWIKYGFMTFVNHCIKWFTLFKRAHFLRFEAAIKKRSKSNHTNFMWSVISFHLKHWPGLYLKALWLYACLLQIWHHMVKTRPIHSLTHTDTHMRDHHINWQLCATIQCGCFSLFPVSSGLIKQSES